MTLRRHRIVALVAVVLAAAAGSFVGFYDTALVIALTASAGLLLGSIDRKTLVVVGLFISGGLAWSSLDNSGCSVWFRARLVGSKLVGNQPDTSWDEVRRHVVSFSGCYAAYWPTVLDEKVVDGTRIQLFDTDVGEFWIGENGGNLLRSLLVEIFDGQAYETGDVVIRAGDTVIDCGAHVGVFTRYALSRGAGRVVAIEPVPQNLISLEANFDGEIRGGKVIVVKAGVWNERSEIPLGYNEKNSARHSFVGGHDEHVVMKTAPVKPLDEIVAELGLDRVDFIKMDIEGAERFALRGAVETLQQFRPRLAICTYHLPDDAMVVPALVERIQPDYESARKNFLQISGVIRPRVIYFHVAAE